MVYEDLDDEFIKYVKSLAHEAMDKAELELMKMKEAKEVLDLPSRKENWDIQENAEGGIETHMSKIFSYLREVAILTKGLETFKNGMIYNAMKDSKKVK